MERYPAIPAALTIMASGIIFDIKEFAVFDGPGIRTTVFFKGCPLRCNWCHNPEGFKAERELMVSRASCAHCGRCEAICPSPEKCTACGACVIVCPLGLRRIAGDEYEAPDLARKLLRSADYLRANGGGYTISGGEPSAQGEFLLELLCALRGNHRAVETSGYCPGALFKAITDETELVLMDLKHPGREEFRQWTGADNGPVLENLEFLKESGKPFIIRIPVIPGVNDHAADYAAAAGLLEGSKNLIRVELLPYHKTAGAKYSMLGLEYAPAFKADEEPNMDTRAFRGGIPCVLV
jgi:pyruvate formate lyase activating enzyme